jgi:hypothetical protein
LGIRLALGASLGGAAHGDTPGSRNCLHRGGYGGLHRLASHD